MFSTLFEVKSLRFLPQLNLLCIRSVERQYTKLMIEIHWVISTQVQILLAAPKSVTNWRGSLPVLQRTGYHQDEVIYQNVLSNLTFITVKYFVNFLCASAEKWHYAKNNLLFTLYLFFPSKKNFPSSSSDFDRNLVNLLTCRALQQKLCHREIRNVDHLKSDLFYTAGSDKQERNKMSAKPTD